MSGNGQVAVSLSEVLKVARESLRKPDLNRLPEMRNDWNGVREFLLGGVRDDGLWPSGTIAVSARGELLTVQLRLPNLEMQSTYQGTGWDELWEQVNSDLEHKVVRWELDYKGKQRLERKLLVD